MVNAASVNLREVANRVGNIPASGMITVARAAKAIVADEGARIAGPDGMKGKKKRGLKLKARDTIRDRGDNETVCRIQGSIPAWIWATSGTAPHAVRRRKRGPMRKMVVHHPGTPGRGAWPRVAARIGDVVPLIFSDEVARAVRGG